jgi:hypothetical protein
MAKEAIGKGRAAIFEGLSPATTDRPPVTSNQISEKGANTPPTGRQPLIDESAPAEAKRASEIAVVSPEAAAVQRQNQQLTIVSCKMSEKICPLTRLVCLERSCQWWNKSLGGRCSVYVMADSLKHWWQFWK